MSEGHDFGVTGDVQITVLVDDRVPSMVESTETVRRFTDELLLAEHGFAALVDLREAGVRVLWDTGSTALVLLENARRMNVDLSAVDVLVLSHGHSDHTGAVAEFVQFAGGRPGACTWPAGTSLRAVDKWRAEQRMPVVVHPAAFRERWNVGDDGRMYGPKAVSPAEWEAAGADLVLVEAPHRLAPGCWSTGPVPRESFEQTGTPPSLRYRDGTVLRRDLMDDDQSLIINLRDEGLVVLAGCAHAGIVNTVRHAQRLTGVDRVRAIIGGFHLGRADAYEIERTVEAIAGLKPALVAPHHCTGFAATARLVTRLPGQFILGTAGTTYLF
ncbi:MAG: MBL fold metallo-hydrolase [Anaerolineae bacterium]|jgi:7,8-dihydropterin-6-yl-methyl-4-(beta-D-ribofuranosyl)aminobenzene 5'-phosphate synthase